MCTAACNSNTLIVRFDAQAQAPGSTELTPLQEPAPGSVSIPNSSQNQLSTGGMQPDVSGTMMESETRQQQYVAGHSHDLSTGAG